MGSIDEIKKMQLEGKSDQEMTAVLRQKGYPERGIPDAIAQAKIKEAVSSSVNGDAPRGQGAAIPAPPQMTTNEGMVPQEQTGYSAQPGEYSQQQGEYAGGQGDYSGMEPSMATSEQEQYQNPPQQDYPADYPAEESYATEAYAADAYDQYQPYQESVSSDIITEIAEQVVSDKLIHIQDKLEKAIDFKNTAEAKITSLNERLKRIEQIMDRLQLSLLQKMGDYVADISDIKHEMIENQESFKALLPKLKEIHGGRHVKKREVHHHAKKKHTGKKLP